MATDGMETGLSRLLTARQDDVKSRWAAAVAEGSRERLTTGEIEREVSDLLEELIKATSGGNVTDIAAPEYDGMRALLADISRRRAVAGFSPSETASGIFALKQAFLGLPGSDPARDFPAVSFLVDRLGLFTFETYARARESVITQQSEQLLELSTPVVKLWDGVVAVPLVGTLDSARTQVVMEKLLESLLETRSTHAIIDITGVPAVDTQVAQHLLKTIQAAKLMGAECLISGIRPQIAQTVVALGIEFGDIQTRATLADALAAVLAASGVTVVRHGGAPA